MEVNNKKHQYAQEICKVEGVQIVRKPNHSINLVKELIVKSFYLLLPFFST